jgi:cell division protein FtsB
MDTERIPHTNLCLPYYRPITEQERRNATLRSENRKLREEIEILKGELAWWKAQA